MRLLFNEIGINMEIKEHEFIKERELLKLHN